MSDAVTMHGLGVARPLHDFMALEALPGTGVTPSASGRRTPASSASLHAQCRALARRDELQARSTTVPREPRPPVDAGRMRPSSGDRLSRPGRPDFQVETSGVDDEMAHVAGPQLVVPVSNARYALNAANARWAASTTHSTGRTRSRDRRRDTDGSYNPVRGAR